jgi:ABC-2 type transport system ATP-binding protein
MTQAISMRGVTKSFRGQQALVGIDWSVPTGCIYGLIGANGSGKTTLLRLALGLLWPDQGEISVLGQTLGNENAEVRQIVQYVASGRPFAVGFRVKEWIRYASLLYAEWDGSLCNKLLVALEINPQQHISDLSSGMQTSLQLAVAIAAHPRVLLLDEPTNGLDVVVKRQVLQFIIDMAAKWDTTIVMATHTIEDIERMADTVGILYRGRFIFQSELDAIKAHIHRLRVVIPQPLPQFLQHDPRILQIRHQGHITQVTVEGRLEPMAAAFRDAGAVLVEPVDMDLTEIFRVFLEKEGYSREALRWDAL